VGRVACIATLTSLATLAASVIFREASGHGIADLIVGYMF